MRTAHLLLLAALAPATLVVACSSAETSSTPTTSLGSTSSATSAEACEACISDVECGPGERCGQFAGDAYCAPECAAGSCADGRACAQVNSAEGIQVELCIPQSDVCGGATDAGGTGGFTTTSTSTSKLGASETCGSLVGPDVTGCCQSCKYGGKTCQANGCYGGWWCNVDTCKCLAPPSPASCTPGSSSSSSSTSGGATSTSSSGGNGGSVGPDGGTVDVLRFAIVGDTRPAFIDDTAAYPKAVIQKIWQKVEAYSPRPYFAVTTGDYVFAKANGTQAAPQFDIYLGARSAFSNITFPALGNHECTGATASNCGPGNPDGVTVNYSTFMAKMLAPLGISVPYYAVPLTGADGSWTAKVVVIAANAWDQTEATWFEAEMAKPTTYTFVVRHEGESAQNAPGVVPSDQIMAKHPYTLLLAGHTHTFSYTQSKRQVITGNGGAPLTGTVNYGYTIAEQRADGAIVFTARDYATDAIIQSFSVKADGSHAP